MMHSISSVKKTLSIVTATGRRSGVLAGWLGLTPAFSAFLAHRSWSARSERVGGVARNESSTHN
jgi:hypothetical protein